MGLTRDEGVMKGTRLLVAEMMILASEISAKYAISAKIPYIYRIQHLPIDRDLWNQLPYLTTDRRDSVEMLFHWTRAELSTHPLPHSSLGLSAYARVSSPARRYTDIINHRQVLPSPSSPPSPLPLHPLTHIHLHTSTNIVTSMKHIIDIF